MKVYLAGPLFTNAEREFNLMLARKLEALMSGLELHLPQIAAELLVGESQFPEKVFQQCLTGVRQSDVILAILDGSDADSGTCIEVGYAHALGKPIVGLRTDFRASEDRGLNLMVSHICTELLVLPALQYDLDKVVDKVTEVLGKLRIES